MSKALRGAGGGVMDSGAPMMGGRVPALDREGSLIQWDFKTFFTCLSQSKSLFSGHIDISHLSPEN